MGGNGKKLLELCTRNGFKVDCFCDNNPSLWGTEYGGVACISIDELVKESEKKKIVVLLSIKRYEAVYEQLKAYPKLVVHLMNVV